MEELAKVTGMRVPPNGTYHSSLYRMHLRHINTSENWILRRAARACHAAIPRTWSRNKPFWHLSACQAPFALDDFKLAWKKCCATTSKEVRVNLARGWNVNTRSERLSRWNRMNAQSNRVTLLFLMGSWKIGPWIGSQARSVAEEWNLLMKKLKMEDADEREVRLGQASGGRRNSNIGEIRIRPKQLHCSNSA